MAEAAEFECKKCLISKPSTERYLKRKAAGAAQLDLVCKSCHNVENRIYRLQQNGIDLTGTAELPMDDKVKLFIDSADLKGKDLETLVTERIQRRRELSSVMSFKASETFMDEADVKKHYKDKPDQLAEFWRNSDPIICKLTKVQLWGVPVYTREKIDEDKATEIREKDLEHTRRLKAEARPKAKVQQLPQAQEGDNKVAMTGAKLANMEKLSGKLEEKKLGLAAVMLEAEAPDMVEDMPKATLKKAKELLKTLDERLAFCAKVKQENQGGKEAIKTFFSSQADTIKNIDFTVKQLNDILSDITDSREGE